MDLSGRTIPDPSLDNFWWVPTKETAVSEVSVFGNNGESLIKGQFLNGLVIAISQPKIFDML